MLIELIKENNKITKKEMAVRSGKSKATIERTLKVSKRIVRIGARNGGYWDIKE